MDLLLPLLLCPLCHLTFRAPTALRCGHSLCSSHLPAPCPLCAAHHTPSTSLSSSQPVVHYHHAQPAHQEPAPLTNRPCVTLTKVLALITHTRSSLHDIDDPRPRKRQRRNPSPEPDLLSHLRRAAEAERRTPPDTSVQLPDRNSVQAEFDKRLLEELTCQICYVLFFQPITTPCQHTFCAKCLQRTLDHGSSCPICRQRMPSYAYFQDHPVNAVVLSIILKVHPDLYEERRLAIEEEESHARLKTPIFIAQLSFPGMPTRLHLFEPRYRLMLRRCLNSPRPHFGMVPPTRPGAVPCEYGTILEIRGVSMQPDGRSYVETVGTSRFRILERGTLDGYMVGRIERIDDYPDDVDQLLFPPTIPSAIPHQTNDELMSICRNFLDRLQQGAAPWVAQRLSNTYGPIPTDPALFSYWVALVLPIEEFEKTKLLPLRSPRLRLLQIVRWIQQLNNNWYAWLSFVAWEGWLVEGPAVPCLLWTAFVLIVSRLIGWI